MVSWVLPTMVAAAVCAGSTEPGASVEGVFDSNGVKIRYVTAGEGQPVVLIHGWMADSGMWGRDASGKTALSTAGAEGLRFIALDCRGHGQSDKPHDPAQYGPEMAADVVRLMDHLKIDAAHLVGYSSGAYIAGIVAAKHPERVRSLVFAGQGPLISRGAQDGAPEEKPADARPSEVEVFAKAVEEGKGMGAYILAVTPPDRPKPTKEQADALANWMLRGKDLKALAAAGLSFKHMGVPVEQLRRCGAPILFMHGEREGEAVKSAVASARALLGRGEVKVVPGGDHMTTLVKPEFRAWLLEFLRSAKGETKAGGV
ncbi:MAG: alpha/beta hydrolase [Phycisphaerae bacterium]|nr:alpha/beta hydrolase [Phycisphaerae bacterium]